MAKLWQKLKWLVFFWDTVYIASYDNEWIEHLFQVITGSCLCLLHFIVNYNKMPRCRRDNRAMRPI